MTLITVDFISESSGTDLVFVFDDGSSESIVDDITLREITEQDQEEIEPINEFLSGNTDNGRNIHFRVDTRLIQMMDQFENYATPLAVVTRLDRGSMLKCFVALEDGGDFYELSGEAKKGVSVVKIHAKDDTIQSPPPAREMTVSWRDSSKQICRLSQGGIIFLPNTLSHNQ